ncbi:MAG: ATP-binding protein [bacterium]
MSFLTVVNILSFVVHSFLAIFVLVKSPRSPLNRVGSALIGCFAIWSLGAMFMCNHFIPRDMAMRFVNIIFVGAAGFMGLTVWFHLIFTDKKAILKNKIFSVINFSLPLFFIYLQWKDQAIAEDVLKESYGWTLVWSNSIWTYAYDLYFISTIMAALYLLFRFRRETKSPIKKKHTLVLMTATGIAFMFGTITDVILPQLHIHVIPVSGNVIALIWIAGLVYAIAKYKLFTVSLATAAENIISTMSDCLILLDTGGRIQLANEACFDTLGYTENQLKEQPLTILLPPEQVENHQLREIMSGKELRNFYLTLRDKNGVQVPASLSTSVLHDKEGNTAGIVWIARDMTERWRAEEEKARIQTQLLQSQKMEAIGILAAGVAHDFNNLLTTIQGYTTLAMMNISDEDPASMDLNQVREAAGRAANLTRQLLLFSRKQPMEHTFVDLNDLIDNLLKMLYRLIGEDITIATELEPHIWPILADEGTIEQVIMNLAVNARDAMPKGGRLTIKTENVILDEKDSENIPEARPGQFVCLQIADTGCGMDERTAERIFEPFFTTKEIGRGTGLGLSVVYGIVKQHEGWINIYSRLGEGSVFKVYLPVLLSQAYWKGEEVIPLQDLQGRGERILVVEDEEGVRKSTVRVLQKNNYTVNEASSGREALDICERAQGKFALVLSDVVLPDQSGLELVNRLLARQPDLKVLMTSGYTDQKSLWPAIQQRGFRFLQKPYSLSDLLRNLREIIEGDKVKV